MKNKKFIKSATLLSSLMGIAILSSTLGSSVVLSNKNDSIKSEINNQTSNQVNDFGEVLSADASLFIDAEGDVTGDIFYSVDEDNNLKLVTLPGDVGAIDPTFKSEVNISGKTYHITSIGGKFGNQENHDYFKGKLTFPNTLTTIDKKESLLPPINRLNKITCMDFSKTQITFIEDSLLYDCSDVKEVKLPQNLQRTKLSIAQSCKSLKFLDLPKSLTTIESCPFFAGVDSKTSYIKVNWSVDQFDQLTLADNWTKDSITRRTYTIVVPEGMVPYYQENREKLKLGSSIITDKVPTESTINLALVLGLSLGIGIPVLGAVIGGTIYGVKKHKAKK